MKRKNSGITLIALIITIIIMLILAGVTISILSGNDGLLAKAEKAVSETEKAAMQEDAELAIATIKMEYYEDYATNKNMTAKEFIVAKLAGPYETSRGAVMEADAEGNITYTLDGVVTTLTIDENGKVTFGESSGSGDDSSDGTMTPAVQYTVTYDANGGTGSVPTDANQYAEGATVTVDFATIPTKEDYVFAGWATSADAATATYTSSGTTEFAMGTADVTLYAVWAKEFAYLFNFDATTGTILGIKEEYYGDTPNVDYYEGNYDTSGYDYADGYGWCVLSEPIDTLIIPSKIDGVEVKTIRNIGIFNVRKIVIEEGIEVVGSDSKVTGSGPIPEGMAEFCILEEIELPDTLTKIEQYAFEYFVNLSSVYIPDSVTSIGDYAFRECTSLSSVTIDSATIASGLTNRTVYGYLINYTDTISVKSGLTVGSYVTSNFVEVGCGAEGYVTYCNW